MSASVLLQRVRYLLLLAIAAEVMLGLLQQAWVILDPDIGVNLAVKQKVASVLREQLLLQLRVPPWMIFEAAAAQALLWHPVQKRQ